MWQLGYFDDELDYCRVTTDRCVCWLLVRGHNQPPNLYVSGLSRLQPTSPLICDESSAHLRFFSPLHLPHHAQRPGAASPTRAHCMGRTLGHAFGISVDDNASWGRHSRTVMTMNPDPDSVLMNRSVGVVDQSCCAPPGSSRRCSTALRRPAGGSSQRPGRAIGLQLQSPWIILTAAVIDWCRAIGLQLQSSLDNPHCSCN